MGVYLDHRQFLMLASGLTLLYKIGNVVKPKCQTVKNIQEQGE